MSSSVEHHYNAIVAAVRSAIVNNVRVHIGNGIVQVTQGKMSKTFTTRYEGGDWKSGKLAAVEVPETPKGPEAHHQFTGSVCTRCGMMMMVRTGTCETCTNCGETGSCG